MTSPGADEMRLTVGILSHKRPHLLARVLCALAQQDLGGFEVVVVGDLPDLALFDLPGALADGIKYVHMPEANVCRARNHAIAHAAGDIVAFCDDDAVPEPDWLRRIVEPFSDTKIAAVGGLVRARDGLTVEWQGVMFDRSAREFELSEKPAVHVLRAEEQLALGRFGGLMGANSAFRREAIIAIGGFDEAYHYFLDETDVALRLVRAGWDMAITDLAEVHHLREVNAVRGHLKKPRNLREVAASKAYFCTRHLDPDAIEAEFARFRARRLADCDGFIRIGAMRGAERDRLIAQVDAGLAEGRVRSSVWYDGRWRNGGQFTPWSAPAGSTGLSLAVVCGWGFTRARRLIRAAQDWAAAGHRVSVFRYQTGLKARSVEYRKGVWVHEGGTWRPDHLVGGVRLIRRRARARAEISRIAKRRQFDAILWSGQTSGELNLPGLAPLEIEPGRADADVDCLRDQFFDIIQTHNPVGRDTDSQNATHSRLDDAV